MELLAKTGNNFKEIFLIQVSLKLLLLIHIFIQINWFPNLLFTCFSAKKSFVGHRRGAVRGTCVI